MTDQSSSGIWDAVIKYWKIALAVLVVAALIYFMCFHWSRFLADFWPIDGSRVGPNLVASLVQWALIAILVTLLYPPARRAVERFATRHVDSIKEHVTAEHAKIHTKVDAMQEHLHANKALLHHIILNTKAIPNEVPGLDSKHQPRPPG